VAQPVKNRAARVSVAMVVFIVDIVLYTDARARRRGFLMRWGMSCRR